MDLRYPIGQFDFGQAVAPEECAGLIEEIAGAPARYREAVRGLDEAQLDTPYRPEGWTVRQTVHHAADSHVNGYIRLRLALTEDEPTIRPYDSTSWGELADARTAPVELSLGILENLHARWVLLGRTLSVADFARTFQHPEHGKIRLDTYLALYAWHGRHHAAHITGLRERMGWK